jgi:hypothetical protein
MSIYIHLFIYLFVHVWVYVCGVSYVHTFTLPIV